MLIDASQHSAQALRDLERDLDLPLAWELAPSELEAMRRRLVAERNRGAQERLMAMIKQGRSG